MIVLTCCPESTKVDWNVPDRYEIVRRIGGGRYSEVSGDVLCADRNGPERDGTGVVRCLKGSTRPTRSRAS